jgi:hypothetical protein
MLCYTPAAVEDEDEECTTCCPSLSVRPLPPPPTLFDLISRLLLLLSLTSLLPPLRRACRHPTTNGTAPHNATTIPTSITPLVVPVRSTSSPYTLEVALVGSVVDNDVNVRVSELLVAETAVANNGEHLSSSSPQKEKQERKEAQAIYLFRRAVLS